jgi:hypothetical protein
MKKYLLIGKSPQMRSVFLRDPKTGLFEQYKIRQGITREITEDEMTFHVQRQAGYGILRIIELEEPVVEEVKETAPKKLAIEWVEPAPEEEEPEIGPGVEVFEVEAEEPEVPKYHKRRSRQKQEESE